MMHSYAEKLLLWFDGMLEADEAYFKELQEPLFSESSHMLELSKDPKEKSFAICEKSYFKIMAPVGIWLETEIGITGGQEDGDASSASRLIKRSDEEDVVLFSMLAVTFNVLFFNILETQS